eukprot:gene1434-1808_t
MKGKTSEEKNNNNTNNKNKEKSTTDVNSNNSSCSKDEIEKLYINYFDEYESLVSLRNQFHDALKNGYFLLTKSRYSMGLKSLGQLQYPEYMKPNYIITKPKNENQIINTDYNTHHDDYFTIESIDDLKKNQKSVGNNGGSSNNDKNNSTGSNSGTSTRRRTNFNKEPEINSSNGVSTMGSLEKLLNSTSVNDNSDSDSDVDDSDSEGDENENENNTQNKKKVEPKHKKKTLKADPIYWFGYMTPSTLKQSQAYFKQSVNLSIEVSNKLLKLDLIHKKYLELTGINLKSSSSNSSSVSDNIMKKYNLE